MPDIAAVNLHSGVSLVINGSNNAMLDGGDTVRGLFAYSGNLTINNVTIQNTVAQGGPAATRASPAAAARVSAADLFVAANANVTLNGVSFSDTKAIGGAGGNNTGGGTAGWGRRRSRRQCRHCLWRDIFLRRRRCRTHGVRRHGQLQGSNQHDHTDDTSIPGPASSWAVRPGETVLDLF